MKSMKEISHRPFPLPSKHWIMRQRWRNLLFVHWPIPIDRLRPYIPSTLEIDTYNGTAWVGVVVFRMEGIHPRGLPFISLTSTFSEVNTRTYVRYKGKPGIFFVSLDVSDLASLTIAKRWYHLPYKKASISFRMKGSSFFCESVRKGTNNPSISFQVTYRPVSEEYVPKVGTLDYWLTERYCLFSTGNGNNIFCGEIHHRPWKLQKVEAEISRNTLLSSYDLDLNEMQAIYHFSKGLDTLFWNIKKV